MTNKEIIARLENPAEHYTIQALKRLARDNNINLRRTISKPELINILGERNLITTTPITAQESNLGVMVSNIPTELIQVVKKKARNAREDLINYKNYIKNLKAPYISSSKIKKIFKTLKEKERKAKEEHDRIFTPRKELSAFNNYIDQYVIDGNDYNDAKPSITNVLNTNRGIKAILYLICIMYRQTSTGTIEQEFAFHSTIKLILENTDV